MILIAETNFLIYLAKYKIADEVEKLDMKIVLPSLVIEELKIKSNEGKGKDKEAASLALMLIESWKKQNRLEIKEIKAEYADDAIIELASKNKGDCFVATHDKELMAKLKKGKIALIGIRQKKFLEKTN